MSVAAGLALVCVGLNAQAPVPRAAPGSLSAAAYAQIATYFLQQNGIASGVREMPTTTAVLATLRIPGAAERRGAPGGGLTPGVALPTLGPNESFKKTALQQL